MSRAPARPHRRPRRGSVTRWLPGRSIRNTLVLLTGSVVIVVFLIVIMVTSNNSRSQLRQSVLHDLQSRNDGYVHTISSVFHDRATILLAVRDELEWYDTRGQMWVHIAALTGEKVFDDTPRGRIYAQSFRRKLAAYRRGDELSDARLTPQLRKMLATVTAPGNKFGDGMKFFYIGVRSTDPDPTMRRYDEYQDSSLWVPDARVDAPYSPFERPWYLAGQAAGRHRVVFTEPYAERRTKEALVSGGTFITVDGTRGTLAAGISIKPIMDALLRSFNQRDAQITIFSRGTERDTAFVPARPKYIYSSRDDALGDRVRTYDDPDLMENPSHRDIARLYDATRGRGSGVVEWTIAGERRLVAFATVPEVGWKLLTSVSEKDTMAHADAAQRRDILISLIGLAALLALIWFVVRRTLAPLETIRGELHEIAATGDLAKRTTVRSRDEVGQMAGAINQMLDNTAGPVRELSRKVQRIAQGDLRGDTHVAAKGDIARLVDGFNEMTRRLIELEATYRDASPLTGLPGGVSIELEVQRRLDQGVPFAFCMFDLDNFKPFNDRYGYSRGNLVLKQTARLIQSALAQHGGRDDFVGHIGGDDFVVVAATTRFEAICLSTAEGFDAMIHDFYDAADLEHGGITATDRHDRHTTFPVMTMTICAVNSETSGVSDYIRVGEIAAELKATGKAMEGSNLVIDRRDGLTR